jgi:L-iditol 2-dehydrogenase
MRRALLAEPEHFVLEEVPIPEPGDKDVIVQVERSGICGSDVHIYLGVSPLKPPVVLGHEFVGTVYAMGQEVEGYQVGDRIIVEPGVPCGNCSYCHSGRYNLCPRQYTIGGYRYHDGGYADYVRVPAGNLIPMPEGMTFEVAAMVEPVACAMHALDVAHVQPADTVLVIGVGTIGLLVSQAVRLAGATTVIAVDVVPERLALAAELGADATVNAGEVDLVPWALEQYGEGGINRVFDTASNSRSVNQALAMVRRGGRVIDVGVATKRVELDLNSFLGEIELTGMNMYVRRNFEEAIAAITGGKIKVNPLISRAYPLGRILEAYEAVLHERDRVIKVMLAPQMG